MKRWWIGITVCAIAIGIWVLFAGNLPSSIFLEEENTFEAASKIDKEKPSSDGKMAKEVVTAIDEGNSAVKMNQPEDLTCECSSAGVTKQMEYEQADSKDCTGEDKLKDNKKENDKDADRNYLNALLRKSVKAKTEFVSTRPDAKGDIPKKCILYALRYGASGNYAKCKSSSGVPVVTSAKPCVTEEYANTIYNSFIDMTNCMDIPQRTVLPKLLRESGLHVNSFLKTKQVKDKTTGKTRTVGGDAGIGQLSTVAILDVNQQLERHYKEIMNSDKESCKRIQKYIDKNPSAIVKSQKGNDLQVYSSDLNNRCAFTYMPPNPLRSLFYYAVIHRTNKWRIEHHWDQKNIDQLLKQNGVWKNLNFPPEKMRTILEVFAYNAGSFSAVILFENWLQYRAQNKIALTKNDFDFKQVTSATAQSKSDAKNSPKRLTPIAFEASRKELKQLEKSAKKTAKAKLRIAELRKLNLNNLSFAEYLKIHNPAQVKSHLNLVRKESTTLDNKLGVGTCTEPSFLSL